MKPAKKLAELWAVPDLDMEAIRALDISAWKTYQLAYFLDNILEKSPLPNGETPFAKMKDWPQLYKLYGSWPNGVQADSSRN